jgi:cytochrome c-type biogenesis protein CcmH
MTQIYASIAIGTAAAMLAAILVLLRANIQGRRPFVALTRRWVAASTRTSCLVSGLLAVIAVACFAGVRVDEAREFHSALNSNGQATQPAGQVSAAPPALESLRAYAETIGANAQPPAAEAPAPNAAELPAVDTMIAKLATRLEQQPDDVKGWKMLGWSYLNMNRPDEAAKAYQTALKLDPGNIEIKNGLEAANAALNATSRTSPSDPANAPSAVDIKGAEGLSDTERNNMIRGMVDQLAARLESAPDDEDGWLHLMRSRMTLGEVDAAKAAFAKALETFANDAAAKGRLTAAANELGVGNN